MPTAGVEKSTDTFEVLCGGQKIWGTNKLDKEMNVPGGKSANGEIFYVCQHDDGKQKLPGTYKDSIGSCCVAFYGKEICHKDNFVLLINDC